MITNHEAEYLPCSRYLEEDIDEQLSGSSALK